MKDIISKEINELEKDFPEVAKHKIIVEGTQIVTKVLGSDDPDEIINMLDETSPLKIITTRACLIRMAGSKNGLRYKDIANNDLEIEVNTSEDIKNYLLSNQLI